MIIKDNNTKDIQYLKIKKENGQTLIKLLNKNFKNQKIIDKKHKILRENDYILFPLIENKDFLDKLIESIGKTCDFQLVSKRAIPNPKYKYKSLQDFLKNKIPDRYLFLIPKSYDILGDIAIIEYDKSGSYDKEEINSFKEKIAKAITITNKRVKTVYEKSSQIKGKYRIRELTLLYGENKSEIIYKENKCIFKLDVKRTFFTPRLIFERRRIASSNIKPNEIIVDLFAGVGPISIQIAKKYNVIIYSFDINPDAFNYIMENIKLNKMKGKVIPYNLDIKSLLDPSNKLGKSLKGKADRIIMNLPEKSLEYTDVVCFLMKKTGGILHNYQFCEKPKQIEKSLKNLKSKLNELNWFVEKELNAKIVKSYSPKSDLIALDLLIKSNN
ncbi:MAG: class I SAM-dependent methyltransferase family protein [Promethearchaeota archaeon]|nr:MAG: class I SAM-dependent methyltransferase family protein [Candidatus Lokiarchaeota archaeon]